MGFLSKFENKVEDTFDGAADKLAGSVLSPVQIAKKAEKEMRRNKMVGAGKQYAPTLYTVLVNPDDDTRLFGYYPTLAGETETYLAAKAAQDGLVMDGQPLVRFIVDEGLRHGKFDVVAEAVSAPIVAQLREEEMARYGIAGRKYEQPYEQPYEQSSTPFVSQAPVQPQTIPAQAAQPQPFVQPGVQAAQPQSFAQPGVQAAQPASQPVTQRFASARLIDTTNKRTYLLDAPRFILGRESSCDIVIPDINTSRTHAELYCDEAGMWIIADLGSTNGTFVNNREIGAQVLTDGDTIVIGVTNLLFEQA